MCTCWANSSQLTPNLSPATLRGPREKRATQAGLSLDDVYEEAKRAATSVGTMGVALTVCTLPGQPTSDRLGPGQMEGYQTEHVTHGARLLGILNLVVVGNQRTESEPVQTSLRPHYTSLNLTKPYYNSLRPRDTSLRPHYTSLRPHNTSLHPHYVLTTPHNVLTTPRYVLTTPHYVLTTSSLHLTTPPYVLPTSSLRPHYTSLRPHYTSLRPHHTSLRPHYVLTTPHYVLTTPHY
eukprot:801889-Prorocentrum_minimum.AAC.1